MWLTTSTRFLIEKKWMTSTNTKKNTKLFDEKQQPTAANAAFPSSSVYNKSVTYANIAEATKAGLNGACDPFPEGLDILGFCNGINAGDLQRYREAELTHGRVAMVAALGFFVGEQVEGSSFLFDAQVTGPAINHFQQVPGLVWGLVGTTIFVAECSRIQFGWSDPFTNKLFSLNKNYTPGEKFSISIFYILA